MYTQKQIDYVHDVLTDLIISCMRSGHIPHEKPEIGDWCIERTTFISGNNSDRDCCIGKLVSVNGDGEYTIETISGKIVNWGNAEMWKIPSKYLRK